MPSIPPEHYADVAFPVPLGQAFSYRLSDALRAQVAPGSRVLCEFGRRKILGVVLSVHSNKPDFDAAKIKSVLAIIDDEPVLSNELLTFLLQLAKYYFAPIGEVLRLALPAVERERVRELSQQGTLLASDVKRQVGGREVLYARPTDKVEEPGSLRGQAAAVLALLRSTGEQPLASVQRRYGNARQACKKLEKLGLVVLEKRRQERAPLFPEVAERDVPPTLNAEQQAAVDAIAAAIDAPPSPAAASTAASASAAAVARAFLLFGVTGSGKTEVYMHAIARCLEQGRSALVLVPEIALTPQLVGRFRARFGNDVALLHSGLADADRHQMWRKLRAGELRLAVGARSALFAPVVDLGLLVVDEEHDSSFKQEEGVRYQARDMALLRAHRAGAVVILGSATPSLESVALSLRGRLQQLRLRERATEAALPKVEIIDIKRMGPGPSGNKLLSLPLHRALEKTLVAGEQAIVFLNRRGFAPAALCEACGSVQSCKLCSVALTYHRRRGGRLRCHYCDFSSSLGRRCDACGEGPIALEGLGTEKLESALASSFPGARVGRLDRDVASGTKSSRIIERMRRGELDILVGTQMVTKGHDLPNVTLVGVVNADAALSMPDFRAGERGFQLLVQVAGRAGRHERPGRVLIQTRDPRHPAVHYAARHDVAGFLNAELQDRRDVGYPPFAHLALLRLSAVDEELARRSAARVAAHAKSHLEAAAGRVEVLGPAPAPIARLRNRYRFRVMLRASRRAPLRSVAQALLPLRDELGRKVRTVIDIDPVSML